MSNNKIISIVVLSVVLRGAVAQLQNIINHIGRLIWFFCSVTDYVWKVFDLLQCTKSCLLFHCILSASSGTITRDGRVITSCWGLVVDLRSLLIFQAVFPQAWLALSPGQVSSLIAASQFRHDIAAMAFCHSVGEASTALLISRSLTWMAQCFLLGMTFWNR